MSKSYDTADQMMMGMVEDIITYGSDSAAREMETIDYPGWSGVLRNPRARMVMNPVRGVRVGYPAASVAWNLAERNDVESICWWNPVGRKISDDGKTFFGANYGQRWSAYLDEAIRLIEQDSGTRRAWVPIWWPQDLWDGPFEGQGYEDESDHYSRWGKDVPCTIGFGLRAIESTLDMHVIMRSQSAWGVFPYDVYLFTVMQELIANQLGMQLGHTHWHAVSAHVYGREAEWIAKGREAATAAEGIMDPIQKTLGEARIAYPAAFDEFTGGVPFTIPEYGDPIIDQMTKGAALISAENAAGVRS